MTKKISDLDAIKLALIILCFPIFAIVFLVMGFIKFVKFLSTPSLENKSRDNFSPQNIKKVLYVQQHSEACQEIESINIKYHFLQIKNFKYRIDCSTLFEYHNISASNEAKKKLDSNYGEILKEYNKTLENTKLWNAYLDECGQAEKYLALSEIESLPKRKMSPEKFAFLERQIFSSKILPAPTTKISLTCAIEYKSPKGRNNYINEHTLSHDDIKTIIKIKEQREKERLAKEALRLRHEKAEKERLLAEEKRKKELEEKERLAKEEIERKRIAFEEQRKRDVAFVKANSPSYQKILYLNKKHCFYTLKPLTFTLTCSSFSEYSKFSAIEKFKIQFLENPQLFQDFFEKVEKNKEKYLPYCKEYNKFFPIRANLESLSTDKDEFFLIEKALYEKSFKTPFMEKKICYIVKYSSPQGRNRYCKEERLEEKDIAKAFRELEKEEEIRKQKEITKLKKAQENAEIQAFLKDKRLLDRQAKELEKRKQEFEKATQGHIYSINEKPTTSIETNKQTDENSEESLSAWEKMKRLKKSYDNGEITYTEYSEKRKQLL